MVANPKEYMIARENRELPAKEAKVSAEHDMLRTAFIRAVELFDDSTPETSKTDKARYIGLGAPILYHYREQYHRGNIEKVLGKLHDRTKRILLDFYKRDIRKQRASSENISADFFGRGFFLTSTYRAIGESLVKTFDRPENGMMIVNGPSGCGKTFSLMKILGSSEKFAEFDPCSTSSTNGKMRYILITASSFIGPVYLAKRIASALGLKKRGSGAEILDRIAAFLEENPLGIIIDEADYVQTERCLDILRYLIDRSRLAGRPIPIFLQGTKGKYEELKRHRTARQILARVGEYVELFALAESEIDCFLEKSKITLNTDAKKFVNERTEGNIHDIAKILRHLEEHARLNDRKEITLKDAEYVFHNYMI